MAKKAASAAQLNLLEARVTTAPCVPAIREAVKSWKDAHYKGVTPTTKALLSWWFHNDHRTKHGGRFAYHPAQREAVETIVYLYEVAKVRLLKDLVETYAHEQGLPINQFDDFARYCVKMATGSGKTKVMSLLLVWQYFNAVLESETEYAKTFLLIAPNVIVFERLASDFAGGRIFQTDPLIPPSLAVYWDFDVYLRGDGERASSQGALYVTNVQQLHRTETDDEGEADPMQAMLGSKPPAKKQETADFPERLKSRGGKCFVMNDEAHHTHDEKLKWNEIIRELHAALTDSPSPSEARSDLGERGRGMGAGVIQLDVTATPRYSKGGLFTWTVCDYPLKQAIIDGIVKRPVKGVASGIAEAQSDIASVRYQPYLVAAVERWREYRDSLLPLGKKPLLFVMMNDTSEADDVADFLQKKYPQFFTGDGLLTIHTDRSGDVVKKKLDELRTVAREVDDFDNPVNAIVSVLMLREGWDVQNVTVIVGLRPYSSKANILPEQTIGRGLRLMFRDTNSGYTERVDIIGNKKFIEFVEELEKEENFKLDTFEIGKDKVEITNIRPDLEKLAFDIEIPSLTPLLSRKKSLGEEIAGLNVLSFACPKLPMKSSDAAAQEFHYEGYDIISLQKIVERDYTIPEPQTAGEVISYYAKRIAQDVKLPSQFAALAPQVKKFLQEKAFGTTVDLESPEVIRALSTNVASYVTIKTFSAALRNLVVEEHVPELAGEGKKLSDTPPFAFSRPTFEASKTVYNLVAPDNNFELKFGKFLQSAPDVARFAKLSSQFGFCIEYTDGSASLRMYYPDFVAVDTDGIGYILETKGMEDIHVKHKDRAATLWCESASQLTGASWIYLKIPQAEFESLQPDALSDLLVFIPSLF